MARIIESTTSDRRMIKMSVDDIVPRFCSKETARNYLSDTVIYIPEDF